MCFRNDLVSDLSWILWKSRFCWSFFYLRVSKNFVRKPFLVSDETWSRSFSCIRERYYGYFIKREYCGWKLGFKPVPFISEPFFPTYFASRALESLAIISEIFEISDATETQIWNYRLRKLLFYPLSHGNHWNTISVECQWYRKRLWHNRVSYPDLLFRNVVLLTLLLPVLLKDMSWTEIEEKWPFWLKNISCKKQMRQKTKLFRNSKTLF